MYVAEGVIFTFAIRSTHALGLPRMLYKRLLKFIDKQDKRLNTRDKEQETNSSVQILARTVKVNEEMGELCNEVLSFQGMQRQEKLAQHNVQTLSDKYADVLITLLLLAKSLNIPVAKALKQKIQCLNKECKR